MLTDHAPLMLKLRMRGAIHPLPHTSFLLLCLIKPGKLYLHDRDKVILDLISSTLSVKPGYISIGSHRTLSFLLRHAHQYKQKHVRTLLF
jgi:hypothetical protein